MLYLFLFIFLNVAHAQADFSCRATYDDMQIPHQETGSLDEFYYCFGFHHGQDRAWEMDYFRRTGLGKNAEVLGYSQLKSDLMMRLLDLPSLAQKIWDGFSEDKKKILELYSRGVNAGFKIGKNAKEFKDLNIEPGPWRPVDSILVLLLQSFDQTRKTFFKDYEEEKTKSVWGNKAPDLFDEDNMPWENNILKEGEYPKKPEILSTSIPNNQPFKLWEKFPSLFGEESGSNNWAISRKKSKSGKAIFANDPHLDLKTPLFWYWIHLKAPELQVIGASVPGLPIIASGTNGKVAWGLTNSYLNSADAILIDDLDDEDFIRFRPTVYIKFWFIKIPFFLKTFEKLRNGYPFLPLETESENKLVLKWSGFHLTAEDIYPMLDFYKVKDVTEMDRYLSQIGVPSWNFVFADSNGDIGFRTVGKTFEHTEKIPFGISTKSKAEIERSNFLESEKKPHLLKPSREYIYTANNRHWPKDALYYGGRAYSYSFRGFRIDELLREGKQSIENFKDIQCDNQVVDARFFIPRIHQNIVAKEFENWNKLAQDSSVELPLYRRLMDLMMEKWQVNEYALYKLLGNLTIEQTKEMEELYKLAKNEVDGRNWGLIHRLMFPHLSKNSSWVFSPNLPGVGDSHTVNPGNAIWNEDQRVYEQLSGASMRMIVELGETPTILLALPGLNRNYTEKGTFSPWEEWRTCQYRKISF